jgi:hypothetical protein
MRSLANIVRQRRNEVFPGNTVFQQLTKTDAMFATGLLQAEKGIATSSSLVTSGTAADFPFLHILSDIAST